MRHTFLAILCAAMLLGCGTKMANLSPSTKSSYFILDKDVYQQNISGLLSYRWVRGLKAGKYNLVAEDKQGYYYQGDGDTIFLLSQERAERYLSSGYITPYIERYRDQLSYAGGQGGIWIPKDSSKDKAQLYYVVYIDNKNKFIAGMNSGASIASSAQISTGGGMLIGAATTSVISSMADGIIQKLPLEAAVSDISIIRIID